MDPQVQILVATAATFIAITLVFSIILLLCQTSRRRNERIDPRSRSLTAVAFSGSAATTKADVYSFEVLMLEVATGLLPNLPVNKMGLSAWAQKMLREGRWMELLDESMSMGKEEVVREYFRVACLCCCEHSKDMPDMDDVVALLNGLK